MLIAGLIKGEEFCRGRFLILCLTIALCAVMATDSYAQKPEQHYDFSISADKLAAALDAVVQQTDALVLYPPELANKTGMNPVVGRYTISEALKIMFANTGFTGGLTERGVIFISQDNTETVVQPEVQMNKKKGFLAAAISFFVGAGATQQVSAQEDGVDGGSGFTIEEVLVTAQKREQSLQDVGIAITAHSGDSLRELNFFTSEDIAEQTPNLSVQYGASRANPNYAIRGVASSQAIFSNTPSPVAIHVDEVFFTTHGMASFGLFDIERVEVLKGPQGTLLGRNTTAGAVNYITSKPTDELYGSISADAGNFGQARVEAVVNGPLTDNLNGRLSLLYDYSDGHQKNLLNGRDTGGKKVASYRAQLDWQISDDLAILFNVHGGTDKSEPIHYRYGGGIGINATPACRVSPNPATCPDDFGYTLANTDPYTGEWDWDIRNDVESKGVTVTLNWDLGWAELISVSNWEDFDRNPWVEDEDGTALTSVNVTFDETFTQYSEELRLQGQQDNFFWVAGFYYGNDEIRMDRSILAALGGIVDLLYSNNIDNEALALFAHGEYDLNEQWKLIGGLRYTREEKDFVLDNSISLVPALGGVLLNPYCDPDTCSSSDSWKEPSGKLGIEYKPSDEHLLYFSYSRGFKSGGYPGGVTTQPATFVPYDPEFVDAWELGFKSVFADGRLRLNGAVFFYDYKDRQEFTFIPSGGGNATDFLQVFTNAGKLEMTGGELELTWLPIEGLDVRLGLGLLDTEYKDFLLPELFDPNDRVENDRTGQELPFPTVSLNGLIRYQWALSGGAMMSASANFSYRNDVDSPEGIPYENISGYDLWNGRLGWTSADGHWGVAAWIKNIFDDDNLQSAFETPAAGVMQVYGMPRTYGLNLVYNWGD